MLLDNLLSLSHNTSLFLPILGLENGSGKEAWPEGWFCHQGGRDQRIHHGQTAAHSNREVCIFLMENKSRAGKAEQVISSTPISFYLSSSKLAKTVANALALVSVTQAGSKSKEQQKGAC